MMMIRANLRLWASGTKRRTLQLNARGPRLWIQRNSEKRKALSINQQPIEVGLKPNAISVLAHAHVSVGATLARFHNYITSGPVSQGLRQ